MSDASNTATALAPQSRSNPVAAAGLSAHGLVRNRCEPASLAGSAPAACLLAAAVLDVVEELAEGSANQGAQLARNGASWALRASHRRYWAARRNQFLGEITPGSRELRPAGSFRASGMVTPCGMEVGPDGNLWVTSLGSEQITVLSPEGELVRRVLLPGSRCWGAFAADGGNLWICDYAQPRLTRIGPDGEPAQSLDVRMEAPHQALRPILGAANGSDLYLILADGAGRNRRLALLRPEHGGQPEFLSCPAAIPSAVRIREGRLYVSSQNPPVIYSRPLKGGDWTRFNLGLVPEYLTQFRFIGQHAWLAAKGRLTRLSLDGAVELVVDAGALARHPDSNLAGLAGLERKDGPHLYVTDNIHDLVHAFRLE